jgi:hypothetical protein
MTDKKGKKKVKKGKLPEGKILCPECDVLIDEGTTFCPECGNRIPEFLQFAPK